MSLFLVSCAPNPGGKYCQDDSDCVGLGGCEYGCWDKHNIPTKDTDSFCGALPAEECLCFENTCSVANNGVPVLNFPE